VDGGAASTPIHDVAAAPVALGAIPPSTPVIDQDAGSSDRARQAGADDWKYAVTLYGFLPSVHGETTYPGGASGPSFTVDQHKILSSLKFAFMGTLRVRKDEWGALVDFFYSDLSDSVAASRDFRLSGKPPVGATADLGLRSKTTMLTVAGTYALLDTPRDALSLLAGARMIDMSQKLDWTLSATVPGIWTGALSGTNRFNHTNWDAIVGVTGRTRFGSDLRWFVPYHLDVGTGDSKFTGQAVLGIGYTYPWGEVTAAWRYIDYDFKFGNSISRLSFSGPALGVVYRF
jgi:hypothetical protein